MPNLSLLHFYSLYDYFNWNYLTGKSITSFEILPVCTSLSLYLLCIWLKTVFSIQIILSDLVKILPTLGVPLEAAHPVIHSNSSIQFVFKLFANT